jgi:hypothetical protein
VLNWLSIGSTLPYICCELHEFIQIHVQDETGCQPACQLLGRTCWPVRKEYTRFVTRTPHYYTYKTLMLYQLFKISSKFSFSVLCLKSGRKRQTRELQHCQQQRNCHSSSRSTVPLSVPHDNGNWRHNNLLTFEVFTAVTMKNAVFLDGTPCGSCKKRRFRGTCRHHYEGDNNRWTREQRKP